MDVYKSVEIFKSVKIVNAKWSRDMSASIINARLTMSIQEITELTIEFDDPGFKVLSDSKLPLGAEVIYGKHRLVISDIETGEGGGEGGFTIRCRPRVVHRLKNRKGKMVLRNLSPSEFIKRETEAAGGTAVVQSSARRNNIARDVPESGNEGTKNNSSWTTFNRLANELGYAVFEVGGTIFFGKPTWLMKKNPRVAAHWLGRKAKESQRVTKFPECIRSLDEDGRAEIRISVTTERAHLFYPGYKLSLSGVPRFGGNYLITEVEYPLDGSDDPSITAQTPKDPVVQSKDGKTETKETKK